MKRFPLYAALFAASLAFASCGNDANDTDDSTDNDTAILAPSGDASTMNSSMDGATNSTTGADMDEYGGTRNADGTVTYPDGVVRNSDGSMRRGGGTVMTDVEVKEWQSVRGKTISTDGTVNDRDGDGRVGTAEVKEELKQGRDAVKDEYKDVKRDIKD